MVRNQAEEAIYKIALEYSIDGVSLDRALKEAELKYQRSEEAKYTLSRNRSKQMLKDLETDTKSHNTKQEQASKKSQKTISDDKVNQNKKANSKMEADDSASANKREKTFLSAFQNIGHKIGTIGSYGAIIGAFGMVRQAVTFAIDKVIEFDKAFVDLAVKSGYTARELNMVNKAVFEVAESTKFSTLEIVGAATELGKLGFVAKETAEMLPHLATLAGSTGESLEKTAQVFGSIMNSYEYSADNAQNVADRLVQVFNKSALDLEKFNTAFSYVGASAATTGTSFDELTAAMSILSDRGVSASKIGTGLRNIFVNLGKDGETLRDVIRRISREQLSFYETAELVGDRAANQLFILMDNIGEFDKLVADSSEKYGMAMEANAIQSSSFSAKWDVLVNNITNKIAGSAADPLSSFRYNLKTTMGLMDEFASFNWLNKKGSFTTVDNFLNANQKLFERIREEVKKNSKITEEELQELLKKDYSMVSMNGLIGSIKDDFKNVYTKSEQESLVTEAEQIKRLFLNSDGNDVFESIKKYQQGEAKSNLEAAKEAYKENLKSFSAFMGKNVGVKKVDEMRELVLTGQTDAAIKLFNTVYHNLEKGMKEVEFKKLSFLLKNRQFITSNTSSDWTERSNGQSFVDRLTRERDAFDAQLERVGKELKEKRSRGEAADTINYTNIMEAKEKWISEWCAKAKNQPWLRETLSGLGITCSGIGGGSKPAEEIGKFDRNETDYQEYRFKQHDLSQQFSSEDDVQEKHRINTELVQLDQRYYALLNNEYDIYLKKMEDGRAAFIAKYPKQTDDYDKAIKDARDKQTKDNTDHLINLSTLYHKDFSLKEKGFKDEIELQAKYNFEKSELDRDIKETDIKDINERKGLIEKKNKAVDNYYDGAIDRLREYYTKLKAEIAKIKAFNEVAAVLGLPKIDTTQAEEVLKGENAAVYELNTSRNKDKTDLSNKDKKEDTFDYFGATMTMAENVYNVYSQIGDMKLELLKAQVAAELEVLENRFSEEANIRNAALETGIISQEQASEAEERARKRKLDKENEINKKLFEAQKKRDKEDAIFNGIASTAQAIAQIFAKHAGNPVTVAILSSISAAAIAASTAMNISAIGKRKFIPQKYADGGLVDGKSHAQGGVPFTVQGRGGYEMEGGEFIVNKESTKKHLAELIKINGKTKSNKTHFATGGAVPDGSGADWVDFGNMVLTALNRPVRAYITEQDLSKSESERNALSKKTSY